MTQSDLREGRARIFGLVLAGGQSRRFHSGPKALQPIGGQTMVERVVKRLAPQVDTLALAVGAGHDGLEQLAVPCLYDAVPSFRGPLAGLQAGLEACVNAPVAHGWLQLAPCDAPFLPADLVHRLLAAENATVQVLVPEYGGQLQPTFSAWRPAAREAVDTALAQRGGSGLLDVLRQLPFEVVVWPEADNAASAPPFFNVNDAADLAVAKQFA